MTALDAQVKATGLIAYKAVVDHAIDNGLQCPASLDLDDQYVKVWVTGDITKWVDSIHVDAKHTRDGVTPGREIVYVAGRLPLLGVKVQLRYSRIVVPTTLRAVR